MYYALAPRAKAAMIEGFVALDVIEAILADVGFAVSGRFVPVDELCQGADYFDGRGPLDKHWRDGDSFWALADAEELKQACRPVHFTETIEVGGDGAAAGMSFDYQLRPGVATSTNALRLLDLMGIRDRHAPRRD